MSETPDDRSDILKYLYDEPSLLERAPSDAPTASPPDANPGDEPPRPPFWSSTDEEPVYRGYLAGTNRTDQLLGVTTLRRPETYVAPVRAAVGRAWWARGTADGTVEPIDPDTAGATLRAPADCSLLVTAPTPVDPERIAAAAGRARRPSSAALRALLDAVHVAFFPERTNDGYDWTLLSTAPLRDRIVDALRAHPTDTVRRFVLPYDHARSESKFYFETWQLTESPLPDYIEEV